MFALRKSTKTCSLLTEQHVYIKKTVNTQRYPIKKIFLDMNILITSIGRRTYLVEYFKQALGENGNVFVSNSRAVYAFALADGSFISPYIYEENYIPALLTYCKANKITAILSVFDIDLMVLSQHKELFLQHGISLLVSDLDCITICNDKFKTYTALSALNILHPKTFLDVESALFALEKKEISFPLMIKPRYGMGSLGIFEAATVEEVKFFYQYVQKIIQQTYVKYGTIFENSSRVIIQEKIIGKEYGLDILNSLTSEFVTVVAKEKIAMRAGESDSVRLCDNALFLPLAKKISSSLHHIANLDVDCMLTGDNNIYVIEMNARFGGQYPFSHLAGVNFPLQLIKWLKGEATDMGLLSYKKDMLCTKDIVPVELKQ